MKKFIFYLYLFLSISSSSLYAQCNLVTNGNFESYTACPTTWSQINYCTGWYDANVVSGSVVYPSADYHNCSYVPGGPAYSGTGYIGLNVTATSGTAAEMVGTYVNLCAGKTYRVSMYTKTNFNYASANPFYLLGVNTSSFPVPVNGSYCPTTATTLLTFPVADFAYNSNWTYRTYTFTCPSNFNAIIIGGVCSSGSNYYIFIDDFSIVESATSFNASISASPTSVPCGGGNVTLTFNLPSGCTAPYDVTYTVNGSPVTLNNITNGATANHNITSTTTFNLTQVVDANGCTFTPNSSITINVNPNPTANAGPNQTINCNTTSVTLNGSCTNCTTYSWSPATGLSSTTSPNPTATPSTTTTYTLTVTGSGGCTATDQVTVTVDNTPPSANAGPDVTIDCNTPSTTLNASGGVSYSWSPATGLSSTTISNPTASPSSTTTYTVTVTGSNGCTATDQVTVTVDNTPPSVNAGADVITTCTSPTATLNGSGNGSYSWSPSTGLSSTTIANPVADPPVTTTYTLTVTGANGCTASDQVTVTVDETPPVANAGPDMVLDCNNSILTLNGSGSSTGMNYNWTTSGGNIVSGVNTTTPTVNYTGTYTITVVNPSNGCSSSDQMIVTVDTLKPVADAGNNDTLNCINTTLTLNGTGSSSGSNYNYQWSTTNGNILSGATTLNPTINQTGTYYLTVTNTNNGCSNIDSVQIFQDANVPIADAGVDTFLSCVVSTIILDASNSSSGNNISFVWSTSDGHFVSGTSTLNPTIDSAGTYSITITNNSNGCSSSDNVVVSIDTIKPIVNAGLDTLINCYNPSISLNATVNPTNVNVLWQTNNGNIVSGNTSLTPMINAAGIYIIQAVNTVNGCVSYDSLTVVVDTLSPVVNAGNDTILTCVNDSIFLTATTNLSSNYNVVWATNNGNIYTNDSLLQIGVNSGGDYLVTVTNLSNGCSSTDTVIVSEHLTALANIYATPTSGVIPLDVDFANQGDNYIVTWDFGDGSQNSTDSMVTHTYTEDGQYMVILNVRNEYGCTASDSILIDVFGTSSILIPNIFSPNSDGVNDVLKIKGENIKELSITIFNRWGEHIIELTSPNQYWDGRTYAGIEVPEGTYFYIVKAKGVDGQEYDVKGSFTLVR
tara:strand:+ start:2862 stop:6239 length:3378 start_codon:yes stop_codon:yes gene_type:complete